MTPQEIQDLFTREGGQYAFARWGRPLAPVVFGVDDASIRTIKGAVEAVCVLGDHRMTDLDPELGANFMWFFMHDWGELLDVPDMDRLVPDLDPLVRRLEAAGANQYRMFRFDETGAIRACFAFLKLDDELAAVPADTLALSQAVQSILLWSDLAFRDRSPLAIAKATTVLRPEIGALIRAAYDPVLPPAADDPSHALRLAARIGQQVS